MDMRLRLALSGVMAAMATLCASSALGGIKENAPAPTAYATLAPAKDMSGAEYVLRDWEGFVGVFESAASLAPVSVTEIQVAELRYADRELLEGGIPVSDREELLSLLEDLGS